MSVPSDVASATLLRQTKRYWAFCLDANPLHASALGIPGLDDALPDLTPQSLGAMVHRWRSLRREVSEVPDAPLSDEECVTRQELLASLDRDLDRMTRGLERHVVNHFSGVHVTLMARLERQPLETRRQAEDFLCRLEHLGGCFEQHLTNLRTGVRMGQVSPQRPVLLVAEQLSRLLLTPTDTWDLVRHAAESPHCDPVKARESLDGSVRPALGRLLSFLLGELLPRARPDSQPGLCHLPRGEEAYARSIHVHTSLRPTPEEVHARGKEEVERIQGELREVASRTLGVDDLETLRDLLEAREDLHFQSPEQILEHTREALLRARDRLPAITRLPAPEECRVEPMSALLAPGAPHGFYRISSVDGSRPAIYFVNTHAPHRKLMLEREATIFHQTLPGHHLQRSLARQQPLPEFRRHFQVRAYGEGWACYAERLAEEIGLYAGDLDRLGRLSHELWQAAKLVVDTGLHAHGWTRLQAIAYGCEETLVRRERVEAEVDRFVVTPAQALAYKLGELEFLRLRGNLEERHGEDFDLLRFHDTLLGKGAVSLPTLATLL